MKLSQKLVLALLLLAPLLAVGPSWAEEKEILPLPRFASLGSDEVNVRAGPGQRYPIHFVLHKEGLPIEIIREHDVWRQIRLKDGDEGWVHKTLLSGKRAVIISADSEILRRQPDAAAKPVARLEKNVVADVTRCEGAWCALHSAGYKGWALRKNLWGIYAHETLSKD